jgi:hypothetical protein
MSSDDKIETLSVDDTVEDGVLVIGDTMNSVFDYSSSYYTIDTITAPGTLTFDTSNITIANSGYSYPSVNIDNSGIIMKSDCDIKVGDRSLKDFMDKVEERLNILHPNPKLEDKWNELAELGKRYRELEAEILEKEKIWKILKET